MGETKNVENVYIFSPRSGGITPSRSGNGYGVAPFLSVGQCRVADLLAPGPGSHWIFVTHVVILFQKHMDWHTETEVA